MEITSWSGSLWRHVTLCDTTNTLWRHFHRDGREQIIRYSLCRLYECDVSHPHCDVNITLTFLYVVILICDSRWGQLPLSLKAKLNETVLTWKFPVLNVYLLLLAFRLSQSWPHPMALWHQHVSSLPKLSRDRNIYANHLSYLRKITGQ